MYKLHIWQTFQRETQLTYAPEHFARPLIGSGQLVTVLDDWCPPMPGLALYHPRSRHVPSPLRAFIDLLRQADRHDDGATGNGIRPCQMFLEDLRRDRSNPTA